MAQKILTIFGTRPEAIKMAPLVTNLAEQREIQIKTCITGQHEEMLLQVLRLFEIKPEYNLKVMKVNQDLTELTSKLLVSIRDVLVDCKPDLVLVHGDTTTTLAASLAAFYQKIPVAHVEAGLRTRNLHAPWPEEANRKLTDAITTYYFAPTHTAMDNLLAEGVENSKIYVTGNTVIDALFYIVKKLEKNYHARSNVERIFKFLKDERKLILVTGHRRESFGAGFERICLALKNIALKHPELDIVYPVHLNPNVTTPVTKNLSQISNIFLLEPLDYISFVYLMKRAYIVLTDSGGIQEEAPSLGKPVLVMRDTTERPEAVNAGTVRLVGTDPDKICNYITELIIDESVYDTMSRSHNPYGDGHACERIVDIILDSLRSNNKNNTL